MASHTRDLPNLDLIRSVAVLLVAGSHALMYTDRTAIAGYRIWFIGILGVCIFFVHTTLVLMWSLERDSNTLRFYLRRVFRLYPLWIVVLGLYMAIKLPASPYFAPHFGYHKPSLFEAIGNILLVCNLRWGAEVVGASWSLPIEAQMYILLPFLFYFVRSNRSIWPLILLDILAMATSYGVNPALCSNLVFCAAFFIPGAIAYLGFCRTRPILPGLALPIWLLFLTGCTNSFASHSMDSFRSGWLFCLVLGLTVPLFKQITLIPMNRAVHTIAKYSYGIYLMHIPALVVSIHYLSGYSMVLRVAAFFVTLCASSVLLYHLIEEPMIRIGSRVAKRLTSENNSSAHEPLMELNPAP